MTVQKTTNKNVYVGDGVTTVFPITFAFNPKYPEYIHVYARVDNVLSEVKNFSLDTNTGKITYPTSGDPLAEDDTLIIMRTMPLTQEMNLVNQGPFFAEDIEQSLDDLVMMVQQINEGIGRSLTVELDSSENPNEVIGQIFDAKNLTQELASEATAAAAASLQSEQNAKASETISSQNKPATDENRSSVENAKSQVDTLLSQVIEHEANALTYKNNAMASAAQASEYEESARANAASANGSASLAAQKASEVTEVNQQIFVNRDEAINQISSAKSDAISAITADKNAAKQSADLAEQYKNLAEQYKDESYRYMQGSVNIPVGAIFPYSGNGDIPVGFLSCNGASVGKMTYPALYEVIGDTYGSEDVEHFNLPNLNDNKFLEGSSQAGIYKNAGLPNINGSYYTELVNPNELGVDALRCIPGESSGSRGTATGTYTYAQIVLDASKSNPIYGNSETVQPKSATVIWIIKAFAGASASSTDLEITNVANDVVGLAGRTDVVVQGDNYIRYANGLQMCYERFLSIESGVEYKRFAYPQPFINAPTICFTVEGTGDVIINVNSRTPTSFEVISKNIGGGYNWGRNLSYIAIGRWK